MCRTETDWSEYYASSRGKPLHPTFGWIEPHLPPSGIAYDLGCGIGLGTKWLVQHGFEVIAVDVEQEALDLTSEFVGESAPVTYVWTHFGSLAIESCDAVVAQFSLFFLPRRELERFWTRLSYAVRPGGAFVGQFLGPNDDWAARGYATFERHEIDRMFEGWTIHGFEEADKDGYTSVGTAKHWHVYHVAATKQR